MKKEERKQPLLNKIMSSKDQINRTKISALNDITLMHMNNKKKDTLNPLKKKIKKYSKKINRRLKTILNTSNVIDRAKNKSFFLKDILLQLDKDHQTNMSKFERIKERTKDLKHAYLNIKHIAKEEEEKNNNQNSNINIPILEFKPKNEKETFELSREKMHNLLSDNILLMAKKREIFSYYLIRNKYYKFNDEKKIRYINKIRELLEIKQIQANKLLSEREKKVKMENNKFFINRKKRLKIEKMENFNKMAEKIKQENESSLRSIKETNDTLNSLRYNKNFLDEEIELKKDHNISQPSLRNSININNNKKKKMIKSIKGLSAIYPNRIDKTKLYKAISDRNVLENSDLMKSSRIKNYLNLIESNNEKSVNKEESNKSIINLKRLNRSKSIYVLKKAIKDKPSKNKDSQLIQKNNTVDSYEDEKAVKSRITSVYEEIKKDNVLQKKDEDFIRNYFIRKKTILSKKHRQAVTIMSNSLSRINQVDITKKLKRIHGMHIPEKYALIFDNLESIDNNANNMKGKIYDSICKSKMNN